MHYVKINTEFYIDNELVDWIAISAYSSLTEWREPEDLFKSTLALLPLPPTSLPLDIFDK